MNRSDDMVASVRAVIAVITGTRALIWTIPVPRRSRVVRAAKKATGVTAS